MKTKTGQWVLLLMAALLVTTGCSTLNSPGKVLTPARVEAVASLAGYYGAKAAVQSGHTVEVQAALSVLKGLQQSTPLDLPALMQALEQGGLAWLNTQEGFFVVSTAGLFFSDAWQQVTTTLQGELTQAFLRGLVRGTEAALAAPPAQRTLAGALDPTAVRFATEAQATR